MSSRLHAATRRACQVAAAVVITAHLAIVVLLLISVGDSLPPTTTNTDSKADSDEHVSKTPTPTANGFITPSSLPSYLPSVSITYTTKGFVGRRARIAPRLVFHLPKVRSLMSDVLTRLLGMQLVGDEDDTTNHGLSVGSPRSRRRAVQRKRKEKDVAKAAGGGEIQSVSDIVVVGAGVSGLAAAKTLHWGSACPSAPLGGVRGKGPSSSSSPSCDRLELLHGEWGAAMTTSSAHGDAVTNPYRANEAVDGNNNDDESDYADGAEEGDEEEEGGAQRRSARRRDPQQLLPIYLHRPAVSAAAQNRYDPCLERRRKVVGNVDGVSISGSSATFTEPFLPSFSLWSLTASIFMNSRRVQVGDGIGVDLTNEPHYVKAAAHAGLIKRELFLGMSLLPPREMITAELDSSRSTMEVGTTSFPSSVSSVLMILLDAVVLPTTRFVLECYATIIPSTVDMLAKLVYMFRAPQRLVVRSWAPLSGDLPLFFLGPHQQHRRAVKTADDGMNAYGDRNGVGYVTTSLFGYTVTVLEGRDRIGGRVHTISTKQTNGGDNGSASSHPTSTTAAADLGATFIHFRQHTKTMERVATATTEAEGAVMKEDVVVRERNPFLDIALTELGLGCGGGNGDATATGSAIATTTSGTDAPAMTVEEIDTSDYYGAVGRSCFGRRKAIAPHHEGLTHVNYSRCRYVGSNGSVISISITASVQDLFVSLAYEELNNLVEHVVRRRYGAAHLASNGTFCVLAPPPSESATDTASPNQQQNCSHFEADPALVDLLEDALELALVSDDGAFHWWRGQPSSEEEAPIAKHQTTTDSVGIPSSEEVEQLSLFFYQHLVQDLQATAKDVSAIVYDSDASMGPLQDRDVVAKEGMGDLLRQWIGAQKGSSSTPTTASSSSPPFKVALNAAVRNVSYDTYHMEMVSSSISATNNQKQDNKSSEGASTPTTHRTPLLEAMDAIAAAVYQSLSLLHDVLTLEVHPPSSASAVSTDDGFLTTILSPITGSSKRIQLWVLGRALCLADTFGMGGGSSGRSTADGANNPENNNDGDDEGDEGDDNDAYDNQMPVGFVSVLADEKAARRQYLARKVIMTLPVGVLHASMSNSSATRGTHTDEDTVTFSPPLPKDFTHTITDLLGVRNTLKVVMCWDDVAGLSKWFNSRFGGGDNNAYRTTPSFFLHSNRSNLTAAASVDAFTQSFDFGDSDHIEFLNLAALGQSDGCMVAGIDGEGLVGELVGIQDAASSAEKKGTDGTKAVGECLFKRLQRVGGDGEASSPILPPHNPHRVFTSSWDAPFGRGGYAHRKPIDDWRDYLTTSPNAGRDGLVGGNSRTISMDPNTLRSAVKDAWVFQQWPIDRKVSFAGEHTSWGSYGNVQGAYESGVCAARDAVEALVAEDMVFGFVALLLAVGGLTAILVVPLALVWKAIVSAVVGAFA